MAQNTTMNIVQKTPLSLNQPLKFDIESAAFKRAPFSTLSAMRAAGPVVPMRLSLVGKVWLTTSHAATQAMVKDNSLFVQEARHAGKRGVVGLQWWMPRSLRLLANNMLLKDEPDHRRLRKLVDRAFQRRGVLDMRSSIETMADRLLDELQGHDIVDLGSNYARRLPLEVICELLGLPDHDRAAFSEWTKTALSASSAFGFIGAYGSLRKMIGYVRAQIEEARHTPRPGIIAELVQAEEDGDKLDESELIAMVLLLLIAGFETTTHLIGDSIIALEQNPDQKTWLLADPTTRMERAVEELARYTTPVQATKPRHVTQDCVFFGQPLKRGDVIMAFIASANSDPAEFDAPTKLHLDRLPNPHLVFSSGIHFCLGMQLARVETQSALARLYARFPDLEIADARNLQWLTRIGIRGVKSLPVRLGPPAT